MIVSNDYINKSKIEKNNVNHKIIIYNNSQRKDITHYFEGEDINIHRNLTDNKAITPNQLNLTFNIDKWELSNMDAYFNTPIDEVNKKFSEYDIRFSEFPTVKALNLPLKENEEIVIKDIFNGEEVILFKGIVYSIKLREDVNNKKSVRVEIKDKTINAYLTKLSTDLNFRNVFLYNSNDKENSILYILAKQIGFKDSEIEIEEIKTKENEYIKLPTVNLKKGTVIMKEMVELVLSIVGNIYVKSNGNLKITSLLNQDDTNKIEYELNGANILNFFEIQRIKPTYNKVNVKYVEYKHMPKQHIFILAGQNANYSEDDAKVIIRANTKKSNQFWKIEYITENVVNVDRNIEIKVYRYIDNEKVYIDNFNEYEIDFDKMTLRFWNSKDYDIFIEKFKILGEPIKEIKDNSVSYTEYKLEEINYNLLEVNNKYINTHTQAKEVTKYTYFKNCREYNLYKFECNSLPFLELEDVLTLNFRNYNNKIQINSIEQHKNKTVITATDYNEYEVNKENYESYKTNEFDESNFLNNSYGSIKFDNNKPPRPLNFKVISEVLGVKLSWVKPNYKEISGYYLYVEEIKENGYELNNKIFVGNVNDYYLKLKVGRYSFRLSTVNLQGIESELTDEITANSLLLSANELNLDNDTIIKDSLNQIKMGIVYNNNINDRAITGEKVSVDGITTENIYFGNDCGIRKDYLFNDTGIVYENGKRKLKSNKLIIDGNILFDKDVEFNGKIVGNKSLSVETENKKVVLENGSIFFEERNEETNTFIRTRVIKKEKSGIYTYNPDNIKWIDVRDFRSQVWNDFTIKASLYSFNVDKDTKRVLCEVVRNENDKHLFYIKVGTVSFLSDYPLTENILLPNPNKQCNDYGKEREVTVFEKIYNTKNNITIELPNEVFAIYEFEKPIMQNNTYGVVLSEINQAFRIYDVSVYLRYKRKGSSYWSTPYKVKSKNFGDMITDDIDIKVEIKLSYNSTKISTTTTLNRMVNENKVPKETTPEEDKMIKDIFYYNRTSDYTGIKKTYTPLNLKIEVKNSKTKITNGGQALWIATEE